MRDIQGDKSKQPPYCEPRFIKYDENNPKGYWTTCPNIKETGGGFEGEQYECDVCGKRYYLDYEDMK